MKWDIGGQPINNPNASNSFQMSGTTEAISPSTPAASSTGPASNDSLESAPSKDVSDSTPSVADPASAGDSAPVASPVAAVGPASKDKEDPPGSSSASSTASGATSDDYEIVSKDAVSAAATKPPATSSSTALKAPTLDIVIGGGKEEDLKESLEDCLLTSSPEEEEKKDPKAENDPVSQPDDEGEHTVFHKIVHCGSQPIQQPKNEENIQVLLYFSCLIALELSAFSYVLDHRFFCFLFKGQIRDANQHSADRVVTLSVPKSSEGWVHVRGDPPSPSVKPLKFPICRIIFFARGNADTSEAACFAFTCVHGETPEERHFITHIFR